MLAMNWSGLRTLDARVHAAFLGEIDALKPGNVHRFRGGHGLSYAQFVASAEVATPNLCRRDSSVGERILDAVRATHTHVGTNTNLGMILLFAPIIASAQRAAGAEGIREQLGPLLAAMQKEDTRRIYAAIRIANPGGLGRVEHHDIHSDPEIHPLEVMAAAAERDRVARQYCTEFREIHEIGLATMGEFARRWNSVEWATVACYFKFLTAFPDSHIARKFGLDTAKQVLDRSMAVQSQFYNYKYPGEATGMLLDYDRELKNAGINPGTSADLTAASLLLFHLQAPTSADDDVGNGM